MAAEFLIYGLVDPRTSAVHYVGKSRSSLRRPRKHGTHLLKKDRSPKGEWVRALVAAGVRYEIRVLEEFGDGDMLNDAECFWIAQARALGWPLLNVKSGGVGGAGLQHTEQSKRRISEAKRGRKPTPQETEKNRAAQLARYAIEPRSLECRQKLSAALRGRAPSAASMKRTPEWKANMSAAQKARRERERLEREASCR